MRFQRYGYTSSPLNNLLRSSVVTKIVVINVLVFILQILLARTNFTYTFGLMPRMVVTRGYIWQIVTYMFLHGGFWHIFLNMFIIWMFGNQLETVWGSRRFLKYYFICGMGGAALSFLFSYNSVVIGASGAGYGILMAYAVLFPHNQIYVWGLFPVRARTLVIFLVALEFLSGISGGSGIAHFAHLGGMGAGLIYLRSDYRLRRFWEKLKVLFGRFPVRVKFRGEEGESKREEEDVSGNIDSILDKISAKGYENLTETERRILENYSKRDRNQ